MSPTLAKALIGAGITGVLTVGGYGIYRGITDPKTLVDLLKNKGLMILDVDGNSDDAAWDKNVSEHKTNSSRMPKLTDYQEDTTGSDESKKKENNKNNMKLICKKMFLLPSESSKLDEVKQWCTKPLAANVGG